MTSPSKKTRKSKTPKVRNDYGWARVKDKAFDAVHELWLLRQAQGLNKKLLAEKMDADAGWVSKHLRGPGNWTLKTLGAFVEAMDGEVEIFVHPLEEPISDGNNFDAYIEYGERNINKPAAIFDVSNELDFPREPTSSQITEVWLEKTS